MDLHGKICNFTADINMYTLLNNQVLVCNYLFITTAQGLYMALQKPLSLYRYAKCNTHIPTLLTQLLSRRTLLQNKQQPHGNNGHTINNQHVPAALHP